MVDKCFYRYIIYGILQQKSQENLSLICNKDIILSKYNGYNSDQVVKILFSTKCGIVIL